MSFRTIVVKNRCKLEYSLNYLICRGEQDIKINMNEITTVIIQNLATSLTSVLLSELVSRKIKVIFCDEKKNPQFELIPYYSSCNSYEKINEQYNWQNETKGIIWKRIVEEKIKNQMKVLIRAKKDKYVSLEDYSKNVEIHDATNREGHAAKVYFNSLFGKDFSRREECDYNKYLDYGYAIILSAINREICNFGYLTQLGIHHIGTLNHFNLSCDLIEPLRPLIDMQLFELEINNDNFKSIMINLLNKKVFFDSKEMYLDNALHLYIQSVFSVMNSNDISKLKVIDYFGE